MTKRKENIVSSMNYLVYTKRYFVSIYLLFLTRNMYIYKLN